MTDKQTVQEAARFIITAVNSHIALVCALEMILEHPHDTPYVEGIARSALALTGEEE